MSTKNQQQGRRNFLGTVAAGSALALAAPSIILAQSSSPTILRLSSWLAPDDGVVVNLFQVWAEEIAAITEGRVVVEILDKALGPPGAHLELVQSGEADLVYSVHGFTDAAFPRARIGQFSGLGDAFSASHAFSKVYSKLLKAEEEHKDMQLLGLFQHGPGIFMLKNKEIRTPDDFNGLRIRTFGGAIAELATKLGVEDVPMSPLAVKQAMADGTIDGACFPFAAAAQFELFEETTFVSEFPGGYYNATWFLGMSNAAAARLDPADLKLIVEYSQNTVPTLGAKAWDYLDYLGKEDCKSAGIPIVPVSEEIQAAVEAVAAESEAAWAEEVGQQGYDGIKALAFTRRLTGQG